ncbi:MAG: EVE domain-containing protein [Halieaceae bacterium]|jgi:predicted RNA-binding protein with PUA-like domain|nr:EVE domain-containing protein [Halieaceae bacterium]
MHYWLMKSEPDVFGIDDMQAVGEDVWDGVRNYQARNFLREMKQGDLAFFYHSSTRPPGIVGLVEVVAEDIVDDTQFDPDSPYHDPRSSPDNPRWRTVRVAYRETFRHPITLDALKATFSPDKLLVVRKGNRLSVMPVAAKVAKRLLQMGRA